MKTRNNFALLICAGYLLTISCSGEDLSTEAPEMPGNVTHDLTKVFQIEELEENLFLNYIRQLEFLSNGNIMILGEPKQLIEINTQGELLSIIGREGRGPGEFSTINRFVITPDDTLHVFDSANARHQIFARNSDEQWILARGKITETQADQKLIIDFPVHVYESDDHAYRALMKNRVGFSDTTTMYHNFIMEADHNLKPSRPVSFLKPVQDAAVYRSNVSVATDSNFRFRRAFYLYNSAKREIIYIKNTSNKITVIDDKGTERNAGHLPFEHYSLNKEIVDDYINSYSNFGYESDRIQLIRSKFLDREPYYVNIFLDESQLWVQLSRKDKAAPDWVITSLTGDIQAVFKGPEDFRPIAVHNGRLYGAKTVDYVHYLTSFEVVERDPLSIRIN
ncbi:MAG: hypothetical protein WED82_00840 [Balneolales bacterium]